MHVWLLQSLSDRLVQEDLEVIYHVIGKLMALYSKNENKEGFKMEICYLLTGLLGILQTEVDLSKNGQINSIVLDLVETLDSKNSDLVELALKNLG